jgi:hypothetical protein
MAAKVGFIYKLVSTDISVEEVYVGSTINERQRKSHHKSSCNNPTDKAYNYYVYQFIRANGGFDAWDMVRLERFEFNDNADLHSRERYWVEELTATLNAIKPIQNCPHGRRENQCVKCEGVGTCEHERLRQQCKVCCGSSICEHNMRRPSCKVCCGSSICEHNIHRSQCKVCNPHICEICNLTFGGKYVLNRHKESIKHKDNLEAAVVRVMAELELK